MQLRVVGGGKGNGGDGSNGGGDNDDDDGDEAYLADGLKHLIKSSAGRLYHEAYLKSGEASTLEERAKDLEWLLFSFEDAVTKRSTAATLFLTEENIDLRDHVGEAILTLTPETTDFDDLVAHTIKSNPKLNERHGRDLEENEPTPPTAA